MAAKLLLEVLLVLMLIVPAAAQEDDDPDAVVGQSLTWEGNEDALGYELTVTDTLGHPVVTKSLEEPRAELQLKPGSYRYQIRVLNVLGQVDSQSPWINLTVLRAEVPAPRAFSPATLYLEDPPATLRLQGDFLVPGAVYRLYRLDNPQVSATAVVQGQPNTQSVDLSFPGFDFTYGDWALTVTNPGGLRRTLKKALLVRYEKPLDLHLSVAWAPKLVLFDSWYRDTWNQVFYPAGANARLDIVFLKQAEFHWGAELEVGGWMQDGGISTAVIHSRYVSGGANAVVLWLPSKQWRISGRAGGGLMLGSHAFDYQGTPGSQWTSTSPYATLGSGLTYMFFKYGHADIGVDLITGFGDGYLMGYVQPTITVGASF